MANPFKDYTLDQLTSAGEQPGSQAAYFADREMQRRREVAQQAVDAKLMAAADAQIAAAHCAERAADAAIKAQEAAQDTAHWTKMSAIAIALSVAVMAIGTIASFVH